MKNEYIIINKTDIQKRIEELNKEIERLKRKGDGEYSYFQVALKEELEEILSQSTPLIPQIEKAIEYGLLEGSGAELNEIIDETIEHQQDYISNLKLDI